MSIFLGKYSNKGILHITSNQQDIPEIVNGPNINTIFHSDLPYLSIDSTYTQSSIVTINAANKVYKFDSSVRDAVYLNNKKYLILFQMPSGYTFTPDTCVVVYRLDNTTTIDFYLFGDVFPTNILLVLFDWDTSSTIPSDTDSLVYVDNLTLEINGVDFRSKKYLRIAPYVNSNNTNYALSSGKYLEEVNSNPSSGFYLDSSIPEVKVNYSGVPTTLMSPTTTFASTLGTKTLYTNTLQNSGWSINWDTTPSFLYISCFFSAYRTGDGNRYNVYLDTVIDIFDQWVYIGSSVAFITYGFYVDTTLKKIYINFQLTFTPGSDYLVIDSATTLTGEILTFIQ